MIPVLTRSQIRSFDEYSIKQRHVPGVVLMENAGRGAAGRIAAIARQKGRHVVIVCGTGNNGGDGFAVARHLLVHGLSPRVFLCGMLEHCRGDARTQLDAFMGSGGCFDLLASGTDVDVLRAELETADIAVDALFGTGLDRPIVGVAADVIEALNLASPYRIALDMPSGVSADTGVPTGAAIKAHRTLTFGHYKRGLLTPCGRTHGGEVEVLHIGVPSKLPPDICPTVDMVEVSDVARWLPSRQANAHKYSMGHVGVFAGSHGKIGASLMVAEAALHAGAGAATIATWPEAVAALENRVVEVMCSPLMRNDLAGSIESFVRGKRSIVIGPGFGLDDAAEQVVSHLVGSWKGGIVIDADAITLLAKLLARNPGVFDKDESLRILTPHAGELARLLGSTSEEVEADRFKAVVTAAERTNSIVVLKGAYTLIGRPDGRVTVNPTGSPALSTAGAGDVLAGTIGALLATMPPFEAAVTGVYVHGRAADRWVSAHGDRGLLSSEIACGYPEVFAELVPAPGR